MIERKATIVVTGEVSEKDFEEAIQGMVLAFSVDIPSADVSVRKTQTPGDPNFRSLDHSFDRCIVEMEAWLEMKKV